MKFKTVDRRQFLARSGTGFLGVAAGFFLVGCGSKGNQLNCTDSLRKAEISMRESLNYVEYSPDSEKSCVQCAFYTGDTQGCGDCQIFSGPVNPEGVCDSWSKKA